MADDRPAEAVWGAAVVAAAEGLHARPARLVVECATAFRAEVFLHLRGRRANARSMVMVLALGARQGEQVEIEAHGEQAGEAVRGLVSAISGRLDS